MRLEVDASTKVRSIRCVEGRSLKDEQLAKALGGVLRSIRLEANLSQAALAQRCRLQRATVAAIERGERAITVETAHKISTALGYTLVEVFQRLEDSQAM